MAFYLFGTIASDWHLIVDSEVWTNISGAMRIMLDGFSNDLWKTTSKDDTSSTVAKDSISLDIVDALMVTKQISKSLMVTKDTFFFDCLK